MSGSEGKGNKAKETSGGEMADPQRALKRHTRRHREEQKIMYVPIGVGVAFDERHLDTSIDRNSFIVAGENARDGRTRNNVKNP